MVNMPAWSVCIIHMSEYTRPYKILLETLSRWTKNPTFNEKQRIFICFESWAFNRIELSIYFFSFIYFVLFIRILKYFPTIRNVICKPIYTVKKVWLALIIFICILLEKKGQFRLRCFYKVYWMKKFKTHPKQQKRWSPSLKKKDWDLSQEFLLNTWPDFPIWHLVLL